MSDLFSAFSDLLISSLRVSTPLLFAALGGFLSERSGVVAIGLEGKMLMGAFLGSVVALSTHSVWLGFFFAGVGGVFIAMVYGFTVIQWKADQIVAGTAVNFLALGLTPVFLKLLYNNSGSTPSLPLQERFTFEPILVVWLCVVLVALALKYTPLGLWIQFAGEHPAALDTAGISPKKVRWVSVLAGGFFAGLGGGSLSLFLSSSFTREMTAGRGFMALAALILGKWHPVGAALGCLLFGFGDALQIRLQGIEFSPGHTVPVQFIQVLPYLLTLIVLAGWVGQSRPPKALGVAFKKV